MFINPWQIITTEKLIEAWGEEGLVVYRHKPLQENKSDKDFQKNEEKQFCEGVQEV